MGDFQIRLRDPVVSSPLRDSQSGEAVAETVACSQLSTYFLAILFTLHSVLLGWCAWQDSPTIDEVAFLPAGVRHWTTGRFELFRVNPPLVRMVAALPAVALGARTNWDDVTDDPRIRADSAVGRKFFAANQDNIFFLFTLARWACIPFGLVGGYVCFRWGKELYGTLPGCFAAVLWCFCPMILGHGHIITPDVPAAALGVLAMYRLWIWLRHPTWQDAFLAGIALGLALLTKSTWILAFAIWPCVWMAWQGLTELFGLRAKFTQKMQLVLVLLLGLYVLNLGYAFDGSFKLLGDYRFVSTVLGGPKDHRLNPKHRERRLVQNGTQFATTGNRFAGSILGQLPLPFPKDFVQGMDVQKAFFQRGLTSLLWGFQSNNGWWYYYLCALLIKVPLGTLSLMFLAFIWRTCSPGPFVTRDELPIIIPALAILTIVSSETGFSRHLRYILPIFPFAFVWMSQVAKVVTIAGSKLAPLVVFSLTWTVCSSLWIFPHNVSYFNELVGGPQNGHYFLNGSNVEMGENLLRLREWADSHEEARPLHMHALHRNVDPSIVGIRYLAIPEGTYGEGPAAGWFAVHTTHLHTARFGYFLNFQPVDVIGYAINIYHLRPADIAEVRAHTKLRQLVATHSYKEVFTPSLSTFLEFSVNDILVAFRHHRLFQLITSNHTYENALATYGVTNENAREY